MSLDARGQDVREVLATIFAQVKKPYALDASIKGSLYVRLDGMAYDKALGIVLTQAGLSAKERDGVVMVSPAKVTPPKDGPVTKPIVKKIVVLPSADTILSRKVTVHLSKAPLATVFATLGKQAGTTISLDPSAPAYKLDANFSNVTLRSALHEVCGAARLEIQAGEGKIRIYRKTG